jgi:hypothetical protein
MRWIPLRFINRTSTEGRRCRVASMGFIFGLMGIVGFVFAMSALARIQKLEQRLKDAGILKEPSE